jgi:hypothetical protein
VQKLVEDPVAIEYLYEKFPDRVSYFIDLFFAVICTH